METLGWFLLRNYSLLLLVLGPLALFAASLPSLERRHPRRLTCLGWVCAGVVVLGALWGVFDGITTGKWPPHLIV